MKSNYYWNAETWGADYPPENWQDICDAANSKIDEYISDNGLDCDNDADRISDYSERLFEEWISRDQLPDELKP